MAMALWCLSYSYGQVPSNTRRLLGRQLFYLSRLRQFAHSEAQGSNGQSKHYCCCPHKTEGIALQAGIANPSKHTPGQRPECIPAL